MKRILAFLLAGLMILSLAACGGDTAAPTPTAEPATEPVTQPVTDPITEPATQPPTEAPTEPPEDRYGEFCGNWSSTTQFHYMELYIEGGMLHLRYNCFSANATRIAEATTSVSFSDIETTRLPSTIPMTDGATAAPSPWTSLSLTRSAAPQSLPIGIQAHNGASSKAPIPSCVQTNTTVLTRLFRRP